MVLRSERRTAASLLEQFFKGEITNDEYDNEYPVRSGDAGLDVVYDRIWLYYGDLETHFQKQEELTAQDRELFERCIAFLRTDFEYEGPLLNSGLPFLQRMMQLAAVLFGRQRRADSRFLTSYWPFATADQYGEVESDAPS